MAELYLGSRQGIRGQVEYVAIKVVHPHLAEDERFLKMFVDEAVLSSRIQHPNVVHVQELGEVGNTYFLVMEFVQGCTLSQLLRSLAVNRRRMRSEMAVRIAIAVADGLHAAHEARGPDGELLGVVHRDVTPENILISAEGEIKVIDFGVAKSRDRVAQTTAGGLIKGKFSYMAPEQAKDGDLDRRTDVYQLGIVLWEMLTMRRCFKGEMSREFLEMLREPKIVPPIQHVSSIAPALSEAVMKALAPDISARVETANAFRRMLSKAQPTSATVDPSDLAELLSAMLGDELAKSASQLPRDFAAGGADAHRFGEEEVLKTFTVESAGLFGESDLLSSRPSDVAGGVFDKGDKSKRPVEDDTDKQRLSTAFGLSEASPFDMEVESDVSGEFSKDLGPDATVIKQPDLSVFSESGIEFGRGNKDKGSLPEPTQKNRARPLPVGALYAEPPARPITSKGVRPAPQFRNEPSWWSRVSSSFGGKAMTAALLLMGLGLLYGAFGR